MFYPLAGLTIETPPNELQTPLFGDATILSTDDARAFLHAMPFFRRLPDDEERLTATRLLGSASTIPHVGVAPAMIIARGHGDTYQKVDASARERIETVAAAIAVIMFVRSDCWNAPSLPDHVWSPGQRTNVIFDEHAGEHGITFGRNTRVHPIEIPHPPLAFTRGSLLQVLTTPPYATFADALLFRSKAIDKEQRHHLQLAGRTFNASINTNSPEAQLIGMVTTLEILLANHDYSFDTLKRRLRALVGREPYEFLGADRLFDNRNKCVHTGAIVDWTDVRYPLILTSGALLAYARAAATFKNRKQLIRWLDYDSTGAFLADHFPEVTVTWQGPTAEGLFPDPSPTRLLRYAYLNDDHKHSDNERQHKQIATIVITLRDEYRISITAAYSLVAFGLIGYPNPFGSASAFKRYYRANRAEVDGEATKLRGPVHRGMWKPM